MNRDIRQKLALWKRSSRRKPLILRGVRQSGKSYSLKKFGEKEYGSTIDLDFEANPALCGLFDQDLDPKRIIRDIELFTGRSILPGETLVLFDEIQACPRALTSLKYFCERASEYHIVAAGSLLGIRMSGNSPFPVGKVNLLDLHPLSFLEFLEALAKPTWREAIESTTTFTPLPEPLHRELLASLKVYYIVGGMPEAVDCYLRTEDLRAVRSVQREILDTYALDFSKHADPKDVPRIVRLWESIPYQLARENKKFKYADVSARARSRDYGSAVQWLSDAGVVLRAHCISKPGLPLGRHSDRSAFKLYAVDVGLLGAMAKLPEKVLLQGDALFTEFHGALAENYVAQQLIQSRSTDLYYWKSEGIAEIDFVVECDGQVYPLEVKAGINPKSKSLRVYDEKYAPAALSRSTLLNLKCDGRICNYPLYAVSLLPLST
jgi:uncharacterized protein